MHKKLAIFCDGTWNDLRMTSETNVALLAKCVASEDDDHVPQIVFYDEGVGVASDISVLSDELVKLWGGAFGRGLDRKVETAYRFIVANYEPGDDIYILGFSRGAYTARSLCGLIRKCGILKRRFFDQTPQAMQRYRDGLHPQDPTMVDFRTRYAYAEAAGTEDHARLKLQTRHAGQPSATTSSGLYQYRPKGTYRLMYLGVWDTVGSLGIPDRFGLLQFLNKQYQFHDTDLSSLVASARHAVALDESRRVFGSTGMANIDDLNREWAAATGWDVQEAEDARHVPYPLRPYQQWWFPGDHGAVGGGNPEPGLSSHTLRWIAEGAERAGLKLRWNCPPDEPVMPLEEAAHLENPCADWRINKDGTRPKPNQKDALGEIGGFRPRAGPPTLADTGDFAITRWFRDDRYRPSNLSVLMGLTTAPSAATPPAGFPEIFHAFGAD